jgi:uncharacterized membrane protein YadS
MRARAVTFVVMMAAPMVVWLALYVASRRWSLDLRPTLPWFRTLRWIAWVIGSALLLVSMTLLFFSMAHQRFFIYGMSCCSLSAGLSIPQGWVKRRFAGDLPEPTEG